MKTLVILSTLAAAGLSLAACSKSEPVDNTTLASNEVVPADGDFANDTLTDENSVGEAGLNTLTPIDNAGDNATLGNAL